jgi:hypothetical protein
MRRPYPLYTPAAESMSTFGDPIHRSGGSYRVLKSQAGPSMGGAMAPRYFEQASPADANLYGTSMPPTPSVMGQLGPVCAYLTMDMRFAKVTQGFGEAVGIQSVVATKLHDLVSANDRGKVFRLQRLFEDERREREPNYLPPIYLNWEDRDIQSVGFGLEDMDQFRADLQDVITFQGPDGQQRTFQVRFGLAKKESTYFIVLLINPPSREQTSNQPLSSSYSRESYSRDPSQYGYQTPQQVFAQPESSPYMNPSFGDPRGDVYRTPGPLGQTIPPSRTMPSFSQAQVYPHGQIPYQTPRSEFPPAQQQTQSQHGLQLPPIRDPRAETSAIGIQRRDPQSGRVDIGGLLEKPGQGRGGS